MQRALIAHIIPWTNIAGTELATIRLAEAARAEGYDNILYVPDLPGAAALEALCHSHGLATTRYQQPEVRRSRPLPYLANTVRLAADFRRRGVKLVHNGEVMGAYFTALAGRLAGARVVSHVRADHPRLTDLERLLLKPVEQYLYVSASTAAQQDFPVAPGRGAVLYDAVPPPPPVLDRAVARAHYGLPEAAVVFGMPARISAQKDHATLIRAMALVQRARSDVHLLLVGDTGGDEGHRAQFAKLSALVADTGTGAFVHFAGFEGDMPRFYAAIDALVLSTHTEGFPLVLLEAMSAALPVIATRIGGIPEAVADGDTGILVPHEDAPALAQAMLRLADDAALRDAMGGAGRKMAQERFGQARFERDVAAFYGRMLRPR
ncbi:glycosyltransferase [Azorhizobium sp. AG788]|uniref:glycosyltransferase n=1 Tax=Azorhizobium sp. AG788 TaxID=2183897 RepID=UPI00313A4C73